MTQTGLTLIDQLRSVSTETLGHQPETAIVSAVGLQRISVRLNSTSTLIENIPVHGGPGGVSVGDTVYLMWFGDSPLALTTKANGGSNPVVLSSTSGYGGAGSGVTLAQVQQLIDAATTRLNNFAPLVHDHSFSWLKAASGSIAGFTLDQDRIYNDYTLWSSGLPAIEPYGDDSGSPANYGQGATGGFISFGDPPPTEYGDHVGTYLGFAGSAGSKAQLSLFSDEDNYLQWDGSKLTIQAANFGLDDTGKVTASAGEIGGWTIGATTLSAGGLSLDSSGAIEASFAAGSRGWRIDGSGQAEFNNVKIRGEIQSTVFKVSEMATVAGTWGVYKSASTLYDDFISGSGTGQHIYVKNGDAGTPLFAVNDIIRLKTPTGDNWFQITASAAGSDSTHTNYTCDWKYGDTPATFRVGQAVIDYGASGQGFFAVSADGTYGTDATWVLGSHGGEPWLSSGATGLIRKVYAGSDGALYAGIVSGVPAVSLSDSGLTMLTAGAYQEQYALTFKNGSNKEVGRLWSLQTGTGLNQYQMLMSVIDPNYGTAGSDRGIYMYLTADANLYSSGSPLADISLSATGKGSGVTMEINSGITGAGSGLVEIRGSSTGDHSGNLQISDNLNVLGSISGGNISADTRGGTVAKILKTDTAGGITVDRGNFGTTGATIGQVKANTDLIGYNIYKASEYLIEAKNANAGAVASWDFQNIPAIFHKLRFDFYGRGDTAATFVDVMIVFNNDGSAIYDGVRSLIHATNALVTSETPGLAAGYSMAYPMSAGTGPANAFDISRVEISGYANTHGHKAFTSQSSLKLGVASGNIYVASASGWYRSLNAISRVTFTPVAGNYVQYSTANLYGIL